MNFFNSSLCTQECWQSRTVSWKLASVTLSQFLSTLGQVGDADWTAVCTHLWEIRGLFRLFWEQQQKTQDKKQLVTATYSSSTLTIISFHWECRFMGIWFLLRVQIRNMFYITLQQAWAPVQPSLKDPLWLVQQSWTAVCCSLLMLSLPLSRLDGAQRLER